MQQMVCCQYCEDGQDHPMYVFRVRSPDGQFARVLMSRAPHKQMSSIRGTNGSKKTMAIPHKVDRKSLMLDLIIGPFADPRQAREFKIAWNSEPKRRSHHGKSTTTSIRSNNNNSNNNNNVIPTREMGLELFAKYELDARVYCGVCSVGNECTCDAVQKQKK
jgi:hypothetical protein